MNSTLPNSDGWTVNPPALIQRLEPWLAAPAASTSSITPIVTM